MKNSIPLAALYFGLSTAAFAEPVYKFSRISDVVKVNNTVEIDSGYKFVGRACNTVPVESYVILGDPELGSFSQKTKTKSIDIGETWHSKCLRDLEDVEANVLSFTARGEPGLMQATVYRYYPMGKKSILLVRIEVTEE